METAVANQDVAFDKSVFAGSQQFELAARMSNALAKSTIVPKEYQGNPSNCLIALEMASRLNASPMMVMQNLYVVNGRPAWSSQYIIAMINASHKYKTELQFRVEGKGDTLSCYAYAEDQNGHIVEGPLITMDMAKAEGWVNRNGSKWKTMPEVMIRYRAASFFGRMNCPDMVMGIYSADEVIEIDENSYVVAEAVAQQEVAEQANSIPIDEAAHVDAGESEEPDGTSEPPEAPAGGPDF